MLPFYERLPDALTAVGAFQRLRSLPGCLFLDSALRHEQHGRYSYVTADPFQMIRQRRRIPQPLSEFESVLASFQAEHMDGLPPFQGGIAGLFGYEWGRCFEDVPAAAIDEFGVPQLSAGLYDVVLAFDHVAQQSWIISQGFPEVDPTARQARAAQRLEQFRQWLKTPPSTSPEAVEARPLPRSRLAPQFESAFGGSVTSTFSQRDYEQSVARVIAYIRSGDVFQVNLAQRLLAPQRRSSWQLYLHLRKQNPAPFAAYFDMGDFQILSASPERFLKCDRGRVSTHPIKGTRYRSPHAEADLFAADDLLASPKDRAENTMIVDLLRNDLSRVCRDDSVYVEQLCGLERFEYVQHLVSIIRGDLAAGQTPLNLLAACFPGGSITGAPKIRAMEIIAELEPTVRGPYCGSLGFLGFQGQLDTNILIRTITAGRGWCQVPVGGGIVALSQPRDEFEETLHKARGIIDVL